MNKSKVFIVIFILSIVIIGPFIIKGIISNDKNVSIEKEENDLVNKEEIEDTKIKEITEINNEIKENNSNYKNEIIENNEPKKENIISDKNENNNQSSVSNNTTNNSNNKVDKVYFDDALFVGDSRTVGIMEYGNLNNATFFANTGLSVYNVLDKSISVPKVGKLKLEQLLNSKKFGKIYVMLGINELGYNLNNSTKKYKELIEYIQKKQPNAIVYIEANLHVTKKKSDGDKIFNNKNIDLFNNSIKELADNKKIFYIDINEKFNDNNGNLSEDYTRR